MRPLLLLFLFAPDFGVFELFVSLPLLSFGVGKSSLVTDEPLLLDLVAC